MSPCFAIKGSATPNWSILFLITSIALSTASFTLTVSSNLEASTSNKRCVPPLKSRPKFKVFPIIGSFAFSACAFSSSLILDHSKVGNKKYPERMINNAVTTVLKPSLFIKVISSHLLLIQTYNLKILLLFCTYPFWT